MYRKIENYALRKWILLTAILIKWPPEWEFAGNNSSNLKTGVSRKQSTTNFPKNKHFLPPDTHTYVCVSGGNKCSFFGKFRVLCFLKTPISRFALLPYYQRIVTFLVTKEVSTFLSHYNKLVRLFCQHLMLIYLSLFCACSAT